jgi:hypothetical protein
MPESVEVDAQRTDYRTQFNLLRTEVDRVNSGMQSLVDAVNDWFINFIFDGTIFEGIVQGMKDAVAQIQGKLQEIGQRLETAYHQEIPVVSLIDASFRWITAVKGPVSGLTNAAGVTAPQFEVWDGPARNAYDGKQTAQKGAFEDVVTKSEFISGWLFEIVKQNVGYVLQLVTIFTKLAARIAIVVAEAVGTVTLPFALSDLAALVGDIVEQGVEILKALVSQFINGLGNVRSLLSNEVDNSKLPHGRWPEAVSVTGE